MDRDFWLPNRLEALKGLILAIEARGIAFTKIFRLASKHGVEFECEERNFRNFIHESTGIPNKSKHLAPVLFWAVNFYRTLNSEYNQNAAYRDANDLTAHYEIFAREEGIPLPFGGPGEDEPANKTAGPDSPEPALPPPPPAGQSDITRAIIEFATDHLNVTAEAFRDLEERLQGSPFMRVGKNGRRECSFFCYRYYSRPGEVTKSHLTLKWRDPKKPNVFHFTNRYGDSAHMAHGIVLPLPHTVYLIARLENGSGLTWAALPYLHADGPSAGLYQSIDDAGGAGELVCGRIALRPTKSAYTDFSAARDSGIPAIGNFAFDSVEAELGADAAKIKNRIPFTFTHKIKNGETKIKQRDLPTLVAGWLADQNVYLTDENGDEFNPVLTNDYTFNVALKTWRIGDSD